MAQIPRIVMPNPGVCVALPQVCAAMESSTAWRPKLGLATFVAAGGP